MMVMMMMDEMLLNFLHFVGRQWCHLEMILPRDTKKHIIDCFRGMMQSQILTINPFMR